MFESPVDKQESKMQYERIGLAVLVLLIIAGAVYYFLPKPAAKQSAAAPAVPTSPADPAKDLKIVRAVMNKDPMGTTAVWSVTVENKSSAYTYSNIHYETTYVGPGDQALLVNKGIIPGELGPGEQNTSEIRDTLYPNGTAWYKIRILDAKSAVR